MSDCLSQAKNQVALLNRKLEAAFSRPFHDYDCVQVCTIYWEENDNDGFRREAEDFKEFVETELKYPVQIITIPTERSHLALDKAINSLLDSLNGYSNLLIIHYGGHGDPDDDAGKDQIRKSVWASHQQGGQLVNWSAIQEKFQSDDTNVLLLLDCCHAAQAARDRERIVPYKVELLAAAGMGIKTVPPGPGSFTTACIREMKYLLSEHGYISISDLSTRLSRKEARLSVTPFHVFIKSAYGDRSIRLCPRNEGSSKVVVARLPQAALKLIVFLSDPSLPTIPECIKQLANDLYPDVTGLVIGEYVTGAQCVQETFSDHLPQAKRPQPQTPLTQRDVLEAEQEYTTLTNKLDVDPMTSIAVAINKMQLLFSKLSNNLEALKQANTSNKELLIDEILKWHPEIRTMEEVARSLQDGQLRKFKRSEITDQEECGYKTAEPAIGAVGQHERVARNGEREEQADNHEEGDTIGEEDGKDGGGLGLYPTSTLTGIQEPTVLPTSRTLTKIAKTAEDLHLIALGDVINAILLDVRQQERASKRLSMP